MSTTVAARAGQMEVTIDKPLGLKLGQSKSKGGGLEVRPRAPARPPRRR